MTKTLVHLADKVLAHGHVTALCYAQQRAIPPKTHYVFLDRRQVTCPRCRKAMHSKSAHSATI